MYSSVANVTFTEVTETSTQHADLRFAETDKYTTGFGYYPSTAAEGGDAWFGNSSNYFTNPVKGNYAYFTMIHEIGHTLGLKHAHEAMGSFGVMPSDRDATEFTVMSYRSYVGASTAYYTNGGWSYPQTLMMYDIAALQVLYGANYQTNNTDTIYRWDPNTGQLFVNGAGQETPGANKVYMTVWDGGGSDTYDFSNYTAGLAVSLQPGEWTVTSAQQLASLGNGHSAAGNIANALLYQSNPASLIENVIGGSGNDSLRGNAADNVFRGGGGNDFIDGQGGSDTAVYAGNKASYHYEQNADGSWTVADLRSGNPDGVDTLKGIRFLSFTDATVDLTDQNDNAPVITTGAIQSVAENTTLVAALTASDADTVGTNPATFTITGGADQALFGISGGNLVFNAPRDYDTQAHSYQVEVTASDGINTTPKTITVNLTDQNDNAPVITTGAIQSVAENTTLVAALTVERCRYGRHQPGDLHDHRRGGSGAICVSPAATWCSTRRATTKPRPTATRSR